MPRISLRVDPAPANLAAHYRNVSARLYGVAQSPAPRSFPAGASPWAPPCVAEIESDHTKPVDDETGISDVLRASGTRPNVFQIVRTVAVVWGVTGDDLIGRSQKPRFCHPRQIAMALARRVIGLSFPAIGRRSADATTPARFMPTPSSARCSTGCCATPTSRTRHERDVPAPGLRIV